MFLESIDHVQLAMPAGQENAAREFYSGLLGIPEVPKPPVLAARNAVWFEEGTIRVHLGIDVDFRPAWKAHPAFVVRGLNELVRRLETASAEVMWLTPHRVRIGAMSPIRSAAASS